MGRSQAAEIHTVRILELAEVVHGLLPESRLAPGERASFLADASAILQRAAGPLNRPAAAPDFGLDAISPEATQLAVLAAQAALGVGLEGAVHRLGRIVSRRRARKRADASQVGPEPMSDEERERVHAAVVKELIGQGVSDTTATLFADTVIKALGQRGPGDGETPVGL